MNATFKTPKGTVLQILNLRGKDYLEVKYRLVWFREDHPTWAVESEIVQLGETHAICKSYIKDETGRVIATATKREDKSGFPDFLEKSETGSIGRALALCGYGTQFCADELDEGDRIVDAPTTPSRPTKAVSPTQSGAKWDLPYPPGLKDRFIDDFGADELLQAHNSLRDWKAKALAKTAKSPFPKNGEDLMKRLEARMTKGAAK